MVDALLLYLLLAEQFETICTFRRAQVRLSKYAAAAGTRTVIYNVYPRRRGEGEGEGEKG